MKITPEDCRSCGACCVSGGSGEEVRDYGYADVTTEDVDRMSAHVRSRLRKDVVGGELRYRTEAKRLPSGAYGCLHLRGTPGSRCSCSIYATRPEICRTFRVGGATCRAARMALEFASPNPPAKPDRASQES